MFNGLVDEFEIYDRALTEAELQSLTESPGGTAGGGNVAWYRFDEDGGDTALDASGSGQDAQVVTAPGGVNTVPALEGLASVDPASRTVR